MNSPLASVIIPTYNDWKSLEICLQALQKQTLSTKEFEILVINNNPNNPPHFDYSNFSNLEILTEKKPGSYAARNKGILNSKGRILAFTDSDCIPSPDWLENAIEEIKKGASRLGGPIDIFPQDPKNPRIAEMYEMILNPFPQETFIDLQHYSPTANMITLRENFETVGLFNGSLMSGGDLEWGKRAQSHGIRIGFYERVKVSHPARSTIKQIITKSRRISGGLLKVEAEKSFILVIKEIIRGLFPPVFFYKNLIKPLNISLVKKIQIFLLHYFVKIVVSFEKVMLIFKLKKAERN